MNVNYGGPKFRWLSFDTEVRPLSYLGSDFTTGEVTGIACGWIMNGHARDIRCWLLGRDEPETMFSEFREMYEAADGLTGHYIRGYDLPVLNGAMMERGFPPLPSKLTHDTKNDLKKRKYISASQENLAAMLGVRAPKVHMNTPKWREANRLTVEGIALTEKRVIGDIRQQVELRHRLLQLGWLDSPKVWKSSGAITGAYTP